MEEEGLGCWWQERSLQYLNREGWLMTLNLIKLSLFPCPTLKSIYLDSRRRERERERERRRR